MQITCQLYFQVFMDGIRAKSNITCRLKQRNYKRKKNDDGWGLVTYIIHDNQHTQICKPHWFFLGYQWFCHPNCQDRTSGAYPFSTGDAI